MRMQLVARLVTLWACQQQGMRGLRQRSLPALRLGGREASGRGQLDALSHQLVAFRARER